MKQSNQSKKQENQLYSLQSWVQFEELKISRLKQQRQRMQNMKYVVQKYSQIIKELEMKNKSLYDDNQNLKCQIIHYQSQLNTNMSQLENIKKVQQLQFALKKQQSYTQNLQLTIKNLKQDIAIMGSRSYNNSRMSTCIKNTYQIQYETLRDLYEDLKSQIVMIKKQNYYLKNILYFEQKNLQNQYDEIKINLNQKKNTVDKKNGDQQKLFSNYQLKLSKDEGMSNLTSKDTIISHNERDLHLKIKYLKNQNKKLYELIDKFKKNEQQQQQLIEKFRYSNVKMCLCHIHGVRSSQNILMQDKDNQVIISNNKTRK